LADLLGEKNIIQWLINQADKFKRTSVLLDVPDIHISMFSTFLVPHSFSCLLAGVLEINKSSVDKKKESFY
jgi:hypothetical protein